MKEIKQSNLSSGKIKATTLILDEIKNRLSYLNQVGLNYLRLDRQSRTLSGGEVQRINLTTALGSSLTNTLFILDEPSTGLHHKDISNLVNVIKKLKNMGNTILIVEHDSKMIAEADMIFEIGLARENREEKFASVDRTIVYYYQILLREISSKEEFLKKKVVIRTRTEYVEIRKIKSNNLKNIDIRFPKNKLTCITGISGSGKSPSLKILFFPLCLAQLGS